jgi:hypothetical protein
MTIYRVEQDVTSIRNMAAFYLAKARRELRLYRSSPEDCRSYHDSLYNYFFGNYSALKWVIGSKGILS